MAPPTRPEQIPGEVTLPELAEHRHRHALMMIEHRCGITVVEGPELVGHALAVLAYSTELSRRALYGRWAYAAEALAGGADLVQLAAAVDLSVDELRSELRGWAQRQHRFGYLEPDRHAQLLALLDQPPGGSDQR